MTDGAVLAGQRIVGRIHVSELLPLSLLFLAAVAERVIAVCYLLAGADVPHETRVLWFLAWWCALWAWWYAYSVRRRIPLVLDMGWFLAAAWLVIVPYFVLRAEGWKGLLPIVLYAGLWFGSTAAYVVVYAFTVGAR